MKLSIVVPVYNVEKYVRKCILSIINQDDGLFKSVDLIIVNDGTKDKSVEQIQDLVDLYDNITLINQKNQGLSMARNNGLDISKGDYVWFIDSDDWITKNALKVLLPYLDEKNDIVSFAITETSEKGELKRYYYSNQVQTLSGKDTFRNKCVHSTMVQKAIYRKAFLVEQNLRCMPGVYNEDDEFCLRASYLASVVTLLPQSVYYLLRTVDESHKTITNTVNPKLGLDFLTVSKSLAVFANDYVKEKDVLKRFYYHISVVINNGLDAISKCTKKDQQRFCELYKEYGGLNKCLFGGGGKYYVEAIMFSLFPASQMIKIYKILKVFKG